MVIESKLNGGSRREDHCQSEFLFSNSSKTLFKRYLFFSFPKQNKETEAKEELKRQAKLKMQRREQQPHIAGGGGGSNYPGSVTGYFPSRFEAPDISPSLARIMVSSSSVTTGSPALKGTGMELGSKKTKQAELLDALGGDV